MPSWTNQPVEMSAPTPAAAGWLGGSSPRAAPRTRSARLPRACTPGSLRLAVAGSLPILQMRKLRLGGGGAWVFPDSGQHVEEPGLSRGSHAEHGPLWALQVGQVHLHAFLYPPLCSFSQLPFNLWEVMPVPIYGHDVSFRIYICLNKCISLVAQRVKYLPAMQETMIQSPGWEDPLEKGMATHASVLAWRIPWTEEPDGLQSMGS